MKPNSSLRLTLMAATALMLSGTAHAYDGTESTVVAPQAQTDGTVSYVTGGIGEDEVAAIESVKSSYNVHVVNTTKTGAYVTHTATSIQDRKGTDVMAVNTGPLLYVNLPAGRYTLVAENEGVEQAKKFTVGHNKAADIHLSWKASE